MDIVTYALSKKYTQKSLDGLGALKGANCVIESVETVPEGNRVTFSWTGTSGTKETTTILVKNGEQGNGITKVEKIKTVDLVDTYRMTFDDGSTFEYEVANGDSSLGGKINIIRVNGVELPVVDKAVDIEIPDYIYIGNTEPTDENVVLWVNPDESGGSGGGVPVEYIYIGTTEPTDENIVLWVNPDEASSGGSEGAISNDIDNIQISNGELLISANGVTYKFTPSGTVT